MRENFGFRPSFVRIYNQIFYSLFDKVSTKDVYEGKDGYLFRFYSTNYQVDWFARSQDEVNKFVDSLSLLSQAMKKKNTSLVVVITPDKHYIEKQYLPDQFNFETDTMSNYFRILKALAVSDVPYLNMNFWFEQIRDSFPVPLYAKGGIHWTQASATYAMDSLMGFIQNFSDVKYRRLDIVPVADKGIYDGDIDIYKSLNLLQGWDEKKLYIVEPKIIIETENNYKPNVIVISDSYYHAPYWSGVSDLLFDSKSLFWYYMRETQAHGDDKSCTVLTDSVIYSQLDDRDYIFLISSVMNLEMYFYKSVKKLYQYYITDSTQTSINYTKKHN